MSNCKATYRHHLLNGYATSPLDASIHFFATIGNGMEWINGELIGLSNLKKVKPQEFIPYKSSDNQLSIQYELETEARRIKYKWVQKNIEKILACKADSSFFQNDVRNYYYVMNPCKAYAKGLNFPDDIQPDWAEALFCFLEWWTTQKAKDMDMIVDRKARLFKLMTGRSWEDHIDEIQRLANEVLIKMDKML